MLYALKYITYKALENRSKWPSELAGIPIFIGVNFKFTWAVTDSDELNLLLLITDNEEPGA